MYQNEPDKSKPRIAVFVTSVYMVHFFLEPHLNALAKEYDVTLILNNDAPEILSKLNIPVRIVEFPIERKIALKRDFIALTKAILLFHREKFDLIHTMTPKAGLIGILAAFLTGTPNRIHTFQGEVWATRTGMMRTLLRFLDRLVSKLATRLIVVSDSERNFLINEKIIDVDKSSVIANGSIGGVNLAKFEADKAAREVSRNELGLNKNDIMYLYLGRLNKEKGLIILRDAFSKLSDEENAANYYLMLVGPDEDNIEDFFNATVPNELRSRIFFRPHTDTPENYMNLADIFVLPSLREGFGVVVIEAAALGLPSICSDIYGLNDALIDNVTGLFFEVGNAHDLCSKMKLLGTDKTLRRHLGNSARTRVLENFDQKQVLSAFLDFYVKLNLGHDKINKSKES